MTPNDEQPRPDDKQPSDDDVLDFDMEDVLDIEPDDVSSASAIEGVEMLDFLDDDESDAAQDASAATLEPTIDLGAAERAPADDPADGEIVNIEALGTAETDASPSDAEDAAPPAPADEVTEEDAIIEPNEVIEPVVEDVDFLDAGETAMFEEGELDDVEEAFEAIDTSEPTVNQLREPTSVSRPASPPPAMKEQETIDIAPPADDEIDEQFRLREEPDEESAPSPASAVAPAAIAPAPLAATSRKKKSMAPLLIVILLAFLLVGGATAGGLFFAGLLPGFGPQVATPNTDGQSPGDGVAPAGNGELVKRINEVEQTLRDLYNTAKTEDVIDGERVAQAQALLAKLATDEADVFAEEPIQQHKQRFDELAVEFDEQEEFNAERARDEKFREYYTLAEADAPASLDAGMVAEARKYATPAQAKLLDALEQRVADYQAEQARLSMDEAQRKRGEALAAIVVAVDDAQSYLATASAYAQNYPEEALAKSLQAILDEEAATLAIVTSWNALLDKWMASDMRRLTPAEASELISASEDLLLLASLEGSAEVAEGIAAISPIDARQRGEPTIVEGLLTMFASAPAKAELVIATTDGERYYLAERPAKSGDNLVCKYYADTAGTVKEVEIPVGQVDRAVTGKSPVAPLAASIHKMFSGIDENGWEATFTQAISAVGASTEVDPVVKFAWIHQLAVEGSRGSGPLSRATSEARRTIAKAADDAKIEPSLNWADAATTAAARDAAAEALKQLPPPDAIASKVAEEASALKSFSVAQRMIPAGLLLAEGESWTVGFSESPPEDAALFLWVIHSEEGVPDSRALLGKAEGGVAVIDDAIEAEELRPGRVVYALFPNGLRSP